VGWDPYDFEALAKNHVVMIPSCPSRRIQQTYKSTEIKKSKKGVPKKNALLFASNKSVKCQTKALKRVLD